MRADDVVEEDEHGNEVVGNVVVEALHADMLDPHTVSKRASGKQNSGRS